MKAKKLAALLLAVIMLLALSTTAFAADEGTDAAGSITVTNATIGKTYEIYKVFDLTYSGDAVSYTYTKSGETDALLTALLGDDSPFTLKETTTKGTYLVSTEAGAAAIAAWLTENKASLTKTDGTEAAASNVVFSDIPYGYYYITSSLDTVVTVDSTLPNVTVIDKNQGPSWDNEDPDDPIPGNPNPGKVILEDGKKVIENTANYGDTVNFSIAVNATAYVGTELATYYYITDTLSDGFGPAQNITVIVTDEKGVKHLLAGTLINEEGDPETADGTGAVVTDGNSFEVTVPFAERYGANAKIEVTYSAVVLNTAVLAANGNPNTANFTYDTDSTFDPDEPSYDPEDPDPTDPDYPKPSDDPEYDDANKKETRTYVYALGILKVDESGKALSGAEFSVKDAEGNAIGAVKTADGVYEYSTGDDKVTQFATDADGVLVIKGVKAGTYTVTEEIAPAGYNLLTSTVDVEAVMKAEYTSVITTYIDESGKVTKTETTNTKETDVNANVAGIVVVNTTGTELPQTGGIGTTIFYVIGGVLVIGAAVLLITRRRMSR